MPLNRRNIARLAAVFGALSAAGFAALWSYRNRRLFTVSDVTAGESLEYPEVRAHVYFADPAEALVAARDAITTLPGVRIAQVDADARTILADTQASVGGACDLVVTCLALGPRHTRVVIRSRSRHAGHGDLGANARTIRALQAAMDDLLIGG